VKFDALFCELLGLFGGSYAINRTMLDLAIVHLARFFGKLRANVIGILGEVIPQFL